jgi:hypothetical protein
MPVTPNSIVTPQGPKSGGALCTTANSNYPAPTNTQVIATAGANGARLTRASAIPLETVTDTQLQLFRDGDGSGTTKRFFRSARMAAYTMAQTTEAPITDFGYSDDNPLILAPGEKLYAAIGATKQIAFNTEWADY